MVGGTVETGTGSSGIRLVTYDVLPAQKAFTPGERVLLPWYPGETEGEPEGELRFLSRQAVVCLYGHSAFAYLGHRRLQRPGHDPLGPDARNLMCVFDIRLSLRALNWQRLTPENLQDFQVLHLDRCSHEIKQRLAGLLGAEGRPNDLVARRPELLDKVRMAPDFSHLRLFIWQALRPVAGLPIQFAALYDLSVIETVIPVTCRGLVVDLPVLPQPRLQQQNLAMSSAQEKPRWKDPFAVSP